MKKPVSQRYRMDIQNSIEQSYKELEVASEQASILLGRISNLRKEITELNVELRRCDKAMEGISVDFSSMPPRRFR